MTEFERLNRETFNYNNGVSRNISPTDGLRRTTDFNRLNAETKACRSGISTYELFHNFNFIK